MSSTAQDELQEGRYRAVSRVAMASLACGVLSILTAFHWFLAVFPVTGIVLGRTALLQIKGNSLELVGRSLAWTGVLLSALFWTFGYARLMFAEFSRAPFGYTHVHYPDLQPNPNRASEKIPPAIYEYQNKRVYLEGYIEAGRQQWKLKQFRLCPEIAQCPYCTPDPSPTEVILVVLEGDLTTDYTTHSIGVGGRLYINPQSASGLPYTLKADVLR